MILRHFESLLIETNFTITSKITSFWNTRCGVSWDLALEIIRSSYMFFLSFDHCWIIWCKSFIEYVRLSMFWALITRVVFASGFCTFSNYRSLKKLNFLKKGGDGTFMWSWMKNSKIKHQVIIIWFNVVWIEKIECGVPHKIEHTH